DLAVVRAGVGADGDGQELLPEDEVEEADQRIEDRRLDDRVPVHRQNVADQHVLEVLGLLRRLTHDQNRRGGGDDVDDADDRLLRNARLALHFRQREDGRADDREAEGPEVAHAAVDVEAGQQRHGRPQRGDLGERKVDEDDPPLHHVNAEVGMNAGQDQAGQKRQNEKRKNLHYFSAFTSSL